MIASLISEIAEGRQESSTSDGAVTRMSYEAIVDFLLESDFDLSSLSEESSDEEEENDISIDSETEEEIILEEHENIIDNIDEEISEAPDASHQTVEKDTRKRPAKTFKPGQNKRKNTTDKYEWQNQNQMAKRTTNLWDEKEVIHWSTRYFCCSCDREPN